MPSGNETRFGADVTAVPECVESSWNDRRHADAASFSYGPHRQVRPDVAFSSGQPPVSPDAQSRRMLTPRGSLGASAKMWKAGNRGRM